MHVSICDHCPQSLSAAKIASLPRKRVENELVREGAVTDEGFLLCQTHTLQVHGTAAVKWEDKYVWQIQNWIPQIASVGALLCIMIFTLDDSASSSLLNENVMNRELDPTFFLSLSGQQLHPECDTGAGHPAGPKPRIAPSLHHAGHWCHEETGMYLVTMPLFIISTTCLNPQPSS